MTAAQAEDQMSQLIGEREAWIEEVQMQRAEATGEATGWRASLLTCSAWWGGKGSRHPGAAVHTA